MGDEFPPTTDQGHEELPVSSYWPVTEDEVREFVARAFGDESELISTTATPASGVVAFRVRNPVPDESVESERWDILSRMANSALLPRPYFAWVAKPVGAAVRFTRCSAALGAGASDPVRDARIKAAILEVGRIGWGIRGGYLPGCSEEAWETFRRGPREWENPDWHRRGSLEELRAAFRVLTELCVEHGWWPKEVEDPDVASGDYEVLRYVKIPLSMMHSPWQPVRGLPRASASTETVRQQLLRFWAADYEDCDPAPASCPAGISLFARIGWELRRRFPAWMPYARLGEDHVRAFVGQAFVDAELVEFESARGLGVTSFLVLDRGPRDEDEEEHILAERADWAFERGPGVWAAHAEGELVRFFRAPRQWVGASAALGEMIASRSGAADDLPRTPNQHGRR